MNYAAHYQRLMDRAPKRKPNDGLYYERHRIIPGCMGGKYVKGNIVWLIGPEHYVAHQLLVKIYPDNGDLIYACKMMTVKSRHHYGRSPNKLYGWLKQRWSANHSASMKGVPAYNKGMKQPRGTPSWNSGKTGIFDEQETARRSEQSRLSHWITDDKIEKFVLKSLPIFEGFREGRLYRKRKPSTDKAKCNMRAAKLRCKKWQGSSNPKWKQELHNGI